MGSWQFIRTTTVMEPIWFQVSCKSNFIPGRKSLRSSSKLFPTYTWLKSKRFNWLTVFSWNREFLLVGWQVNGNRTIEWQRPLDSWLADNGCTRQTCFLTATYKEAETNRLVAPDSYLFPSNFTAITNLQKAIVQVSSSPSCWPFLDNHSATLRFLWFIETITDVIRWWT